MAQASVGSGWDLFVESDGWDLFVDAAGSANELSEDDDPDAAEEHPTTNLCSDSEEHLYEERSVKLLTDLLRPRGGRRPDIHNVTAVKRRVNRKGGHADRVAKIFESVIAAVNDVHSLAAHPLTLRAVLARTAEGNSILGEGHVAKEALVLAQVAVDTAGVAGRACKSAVTGLMAKKNTAGQLSTKHVAAVTQQSQSHVSACRRAAENDNFGTFAVLNKGMREFPCRAEGVNACTET